MLQFIRSRLVPQRLWSVSFAMLLLRLCVGIGLFQSGMGKVHKLRGTCAEDPLPTCEADEKKDCGDDASCKHVPDVCAAKRKEACEAQGQKALEWFATLRLFGHDEWKMPGPPKVNFTLAAVQEVGAGALLTIGLATRLAALPAIATMAVACATDDWKSFNKDLDFSSDQAFMYLAMAVTLLVLGPGRVALDALLATAGGSKGAGAAAKKPKA